MNASAVNLPGGETSKLWNDLGVFVMCEGSDRGRQVCDLLNQFGNNAAWWSFEALASVRLRQVAASAAARADLIILAAQEGPGLPEAVMEWISHWLAIKECCPQALVALLDAELGGDRTSGRVLAQLKDVAELGGLDFFTEGTDGELETAVISGVGAVVRRKGADQPKPPNLKPVK
jgi:hypothetical protein